MSTQYGIAGYIIGGNKKTEGIYLLEGTEYAPALSPRRAVVELPQTHYSIPMWDDPLSEITIGMKVRVQGVDASSMRDYWNILTGLLGMGTNKPVALTRHRGEHVDYADAQLISTTSPDFSCPDNRADVNIIMGIPGGAWRGPYEEQSFTPGSGRSLDTAVESTRPITDAMIRMQGPATSLTITDTISGTGLQWSVTGGITGLQYLLIDCATLRARVQTTTTWDITQGGSASAGLVYVGSGPLAIASRWSGPIPTTTSSLTISVAGGSGPVTFRTRYAVV